MSRRVLRVLRPCGQGWDQLAGQGATRYCGECDTVVHDLDALSAKQVLALIRQHPEGFCGIHLTDQTGEFVEMFRVMGYIAPVTPCAKPR